MSKIPELFAELSELSCEVFIEESDERSDRREREQEELEEGEGVGAWGLSPYSAK